MMTNCASQEMRVLSDAEIAIVAGGPDPNEAGVDVLVDRNDMTWLSPDGAFVRSHMDTPAGQMPTTAYDSDGNGSYDFIWMQTPNGAWICSQNGTDWGICSSPLPLIEAYLDSFEEPNEVEG